MARQLQERQLLSDGWTTEWEPAFTQPPSSVESEQEWRNHVRKLNQEAKQKNSNLRFRSVELDENSS